MRGRKPIPTRLKVITGNPGKRPLNKLEPRPLASAPTCPDWLSPDAKEQWDALLPELDEVGLLTKIDVSAYTALCEAWALLKQASQALQKDGIVLLDKDGNLIRTNPTVRVIKAAMDTIRALSAEFGLTPSSRSKVTVTPNRSPNPFARLGR